MEHEHAEHTEAGHGDHAPVHAPAHAPAAHGNSHAANAPAATTHAAHAPAHAPAAHGNSHAAPAHTPSAPATGERPIVSAYKSVKAGLTNSASQVVSTSSAFGIWIRKVLRAGDLKPVQQVSILKTPFYAAGHTIDGTALNIARRGVEVTEPAVSAIRAFFRSTIGTILQPIHSIMHPIQTLKNPVRIGTSALMMAKNAVMALPRAAHEFTDRGIARTTEQVNTQISRIPLIGSLIAKPTNWVSRQVADIIGSVKRGVEWVTSPVDHMHNAVAPA